MGKGIYLTEKELSALRTTANEWCEMMGDGDEKACQCVNDRLNDGLGSALYKLYKGLNGEKSYKHYISKLN